MVLPICWISFGEILSTLFPGKRAGVVGTSLIFVGAVTAISWLFVRKYRRHFTSAERSKLIGICVGWAVLLESGGLLYAVSAGLVDSARVGVLMFAASFAFAIDTFFLWVGFSFTSRRFIAKYLEAHSPEPAVKD